MFYYFSFLFRRTFCSWGISNSFWVGLFTSLASATGLSSTAIISISKYLFIWKNTVAIISLYYCSQSMRQNKMTDINAILLKIVDSLLKQVKHNRYNRYSKIKKNKSSDSFIIILMTRETKNTSIWFVWFWKYVDLA